MSKTQGGDPAKAGEERTYDGQTKDSIKFVNNHIFARGDGSAADRIIRDLIARVEELEAVVARCEQGATKNPDQER